MQDNSYISFKTTKKQKKRMIYFIIFIFVTINFALDNFLPSSEAMSKYFGVSIDYIQFAFSIFTISNIFSCFFGSLFLQKIKRKTLLLISLIIIIFGVFSCAIAVTYTQVLLGRFIYGLGYGGALIYSFSAMSDTYKGKVLARVFAFATMLLALVPSIAPTTGGIVQETLGWRYNFIIPLFLIAFSGYLGMKYLPETSVYYDKDIKLKLMVRNFFVPIKSKQFLLCIGLAIFCVASYYIYITVSPAIFLKKLDLSPVDFGMLSIYLSFIFVGATNLNKFLLKSKSYRYIMLLGCAICIIGCSLFLFFAIINYSNTYTVVFPALTILFGFYMIGANVMTIAISRTNNFYGTASGLFTVLRGIGIAALTTAVLYVPTSSLIPLAVFFIAMFIISLFLIVPIMNFSKVARGR